jgi:ADP-ribosylglycohydrolase
MKPNMITEVNNIMSRIPMINEKCAGAFVASAIGDALGWPNELRASNTSKKNKPISDFVEWQRRSGGRYWNHSEKILAGEYSDDTQMNLAVARSILSGKPWVTHLSQIELPFWLEYERGGGSAVKRAAELWKKKTVPWKSSANDVKKYFDAGGNGAAMRVLPHIIAGHREDFENVFRNVAQDSILTHGHPRAIVGALCYSYALMFLFKKNDTLAFGELVDAVVGAKDVWGNLQSYVDMEWLKIAEIYEFPKLWSKTVDDMVVQLNYIATALSKGALDSESETLATIGCFNKNVNGAGDVAALASIYVASKYANNPVLGIKAVANAFGSDTDTIASMVGGLLGALMGLSWIPAEWKAVQDYDCLVRMSEFLSAENGVDKAKEYTSKVLLENSEWEKASIGRLKKISTNTLPSGKTGIVTINKYVTVLGQTIYVKKMTREKVIDTPPHGECDYSLQQPLATRCTLRMDSLRIKEYRANHALMSISVSQLCVAMELISAGITDNKKLANKIGIDEASVKMIIDLISMN